MHSPDETIMWEGSVRVHDLPGKFAATAAAGFDGLALTPSAYLDAMSQGMTADQIVQGARRNNLSLHLDTVTGWAPIRVPKNADPALIKRFDHSVADCLELVDTLDLRSILAVAVFDADVLTQDELVDGFRALCREAERRGVPVDLEFMPFWGIPDLAAAWDIVQRADSEVAGIMVDTWHLAHTTAGLRPLDAIPDQVRIDLQLADGVQTPPGKDLIQATMNERLLPGRGSLPVSQVVTTIANRGTGYSAGPEVFSVELDTMSPEEAGALLGASTREVLSDHQPD